jgi:hypothetical protein
MNRVSEEAQEVFTQLVAWELLGRKDLCPKTLLRQVPLADLTIAKKNIEDSGTMGSFTCLRMVQFEIEYKTGNLADWDYELSDAGETKLFVTLNKPLSYIQGTYSVPMPTIHYASEVRH